MKPLNVVIIEDEEPHFQLMKRAINKELPLASVDYFEEGYACLQRLDEISPDVIITDYLMPGMNGIEFLKALNRENKDIPVIMITGQGSESIAVQAMKLGAWDYLVKTPDFFTLLPSVIEKVVRERRLKDTLGETERRFRDLAESTSDWIWEMDAEGKYVYSNPVVESILGYRPDEMLGKYFYDFFSQKEMETSAHTSLQAMAAGKPISGFDNCYIHKEGYVVVLEAKGVPFFDKAGNLLGYRGINRDVTARKRAEERIHSLSRQLMKAQEAERQRLSRELHDLVGQDLSALKMGLDTLFDDQPEDLPAMRQRVAKLSKIAHGTIMAVRDLAYALRPVGLDQLGLAQTIFRHCEDFSARTGVKVDFFAAGMEDLELDSDIEIALYRLIQEGLNNVKKHADATDAIIRLVASYPNIILRIEDNGKGFDAENRLASAINEKRMGLRSMEERVALLGGKMRIESRPMQGTKILIEVPCKGNSIGC
ncbi:MAG: response regulator [Deltaproteobacteria bacterium]|nr:response regulator [Deltaproteobacteria bacterium]MBW1967404.1 response regulator [Deltaproteobacteria bacterium]MBW2098342.1 response regulator [Deltaproteobacteria bacterium]